MLRLTVQPMSVTRDWTPTAASNSTAAVTRLSTGFSRKRRSYAHRGRSRRPSATESSRRAPQSDLGNQDARHPDQVHAPLLTGQDPTVDLIVGLRRLAWLEVTPAQLLDGHVTRDWGVLCAEDVKANELLLQGRLPALVELPKYVCGRLTSTRGRGCPRRSRYPVLRTTRPARVTRLRALEGERDPKRCAPADPLQP
jgi:hypothetical protein